jgi:predicted RNA-binding protein YlxR (DUF448 family)
LVSTAVAVMVSTFDEVAEARDRRLLGAALDALNDQLHEVINRNADGVNRAAIKLRRETDLLLSLGISDPFAAKAGSYAQMALELANAGRGIYLQAESHNLSPKERADLVARAMTLMLRAEMLMGAAKKNNLANIQAALAQQEQRMRSARAVLLCS